MDRDLIYCYKSAQLLVLTYSHFLEYFLNTENVHTFLAFILFYFYIYFLLQVRVNGQLVSFQIDNSNVECGLLDYKSVQVHLQICWGFKFEGGLGRTLII